MDRRDIKLELGDDLQNVDLNDLIHGITASQQEAMMTNSINVDPDEFHPGGSQILPQTDLIELYPVQNVPHPATPAVEGRLQPPTSLISYPGPHNFFVQFSEAQDLTKSTPWIYSQKLNKLYAVPNKPVPVHFQVAGLCQPEDYLNFQVRVQAHFSQAQHLHDVVQRCVLHKDQPHLSTDFTSLQNLCGSHFIVNDNPAARYVESEKGHRALLLRLTPPATGETHVTSLLRFMCLSSCMGGINRRPITIVFTLETLQGDVLGRSCVLLRVCSSPGRDIKTDEEKLERKRSSQANLATQDQNQYVSVEVPQGKRKRGNDPQPESLDLAVSPAMLVAQDDDEVYTLQVRGRLKFEYVRGMLASLDFMERKKLQK